MFLTYKNKGKIDWEQLYTYTDEKVMDIDYASEKIQSCKDVLSSDVAPLWQTACHHQNSNQIFLESIKKLQGKNHILDDFIMAEEHYQKIESTINPIYDFSQKIGNPVRRQDWLHSDEYDTMPNIALYRGLETPPTPDVYEVVQKIVENQTSKEVLQAKRMSDPIKKKDAKDNQDAVKELLEKTSSRF